MNVGAWHRGDAETMNAMVVSLAPDLWRIARAGFFATDGQRVRVRGIEDPDTAFELVVEALARTFAPEERARDQGQENVQRRAFENARSVLLAYARRSAREVSVGEETVDLDGALDLDALVEGRGTLANDPIGFDFEEEQRADAELKVVRAYLEALPPRLARTVELRWVAGEPLDAVAKALDAGPSAVRAWGRRIHRELAHRLRTTGHRHVGPAALDALLAGTPLSPIPVRVTLERLVRRVAQRTFTEEPATFRVRAAWGAGAVIFAAVALGLSGLA